MTHLMASFGLFMVLHCSVFFTANAIVWRFFSDEIRDSLDFLLLVFVFSFAEILLVMGILGFLGYLSLWPVTAAVGGLALFFCLLWCEGFGKLRPLFFRKTEKLPLEWIFGVFGFFLVFGTVELFSSFFQFPWEYDTLAYHMPMVVEWLQTHSLWTVLYSVFGGPLGYYPGNHELVMAWLTLPFGRDFFVNVGNFLIAAVLIMSIHKILKAMKVSDFLSWMGAAMVMAMPIFLRQIGTEQVDMLMALSLCLSWYFALRTFQRKDGLLMLPMLLSMAIMLGTKYLALLYIIPLTVVFFLLGKYWKSASRLWAVWFFLILGSLGSFWYWRNLLLTGNPIFPAELKIGDTLLIKGYSGLMERIQELSLFSRTKNPEQWALWISTMIRETGWYLYLMVGAYGLLIVELFAKLCTRTLARGEGKLSTIVLLLVPLFLYLYFISPYSAAMMEHNVRYAMPWLILSVVLIVFALQKLGSLRRPFVLLFLGLLWWQFLTLMPRIRLGTQTFFDLFIVQRFPLLLVVFLSSLVLLSFSFQAWKRKRRYWPAILGFSLAIFFLFFQQATDARLALRQESWQRKYAFPLMKAYEWLESHAEKDSPLAQALSPLYYPLYGPSLERKVRYININDCGNCDYSDYHKKSMGVRDAPNFEAWKKNLSAFGAQYLLLGYTFAQDLENVRPYEMEWVKAYPKYFETVFSQDGVGIYKLKF